MLLTMPLYEKVPYVPLNVFIQETILFLILAFLNKKRN